MAGLTVRAASRASSKALYVDLPFRKLPAMPIILTEPAAGSAALVKPAEAAAAAAAAPRNRRRFMLLISSFVVGLPPCPKARGGQGKTAHNGPESPSRKVCQRQVIGWQGFQGGTRLP